MIQFGLILLPHLPSVDRLTSLTSGANDHFIEKPSVNNSDLLIQFLFKGKLHICAVNMSICINNFCFRKRSNDVAEIC